MDKLKTSIILHLKSNPQGRIISDLVRKLKAGRATIMIRLAEMRSQGMLHEQQVGSAKLIFLKKGCKNGKANTDSRKRA